MPTVMYTDAGSLIWITVQAIISYQLVINSCYEVNIRVMKKQLSQHKCYVKNGIVLTWLEDSNNFSKVLS